MPEEIETNPVTREYLEKAAQFAGEVLEHFAIVGLPKLTPDQEEAGTLVHPVIKASGNAQLLCFVMDQAAVELHGERIRVENESEETGTGN